MAKTNRYAQLDPSGSQKVIDISGPQLSSSKREIHFQTQSGILRLCQGPNSVIVDDWDEFPLLKPALMEAVSSWSTGVSWMTIKHFALDINRGLLAFLRERAEPQTVHIADIDQNLVGEFKAWLAQRDSEGAPRWKPSSQAKLFAVVKTLASRWRASKRFTSHVPKGLQLEADNFHGRKVSSEPVRVLDDEALQLIMRAALAECRALRLAVESAWKQLDNEALCEDDSSKRLRATRLKYQGCHGGVFPTYQWLYDNDRKLWDELLGRGKVIGSDLALLRLPFMPTGRDLIPFVLLLAFYTGFNPEALRGIKLSDIDYPDGLGGKRIRFAPFKGRSARSQIRTFALGDPDGPAAMVEFLTKWSAPIRKLGAPSEAELLFAMVAPSDNSGSPSAQCSVFRHEKGSGTRWHWNFQKFIKENQLPSFTLAQVRKTTLDLVHEMTGGDLKAVAVVGGQRSAQTIEDHYTSDAARLRNSERLGGIMATRERWVGSGGAATDSRSEPRSSDLGAATPGFHCLDPFASPIPGEVEGRLCQAYGSCPKCPLACARRGDPYVLARFIQLRSEIATAQEELDSRRWTAAWLPALTRLDEHWIPVCATPETMAAAAQLTLPPLPPLE